MSATPLTIIEDSLGVTFSPPQIPPGASVTGTETLDGPSSDDQRTETVNVELAGGSTAQATATITTPACVGPPPPPDIAFTFTNEPSVASATVGQTVDYSYCGRNESDVELEVIRVVDDRFGTLELPDVATVVAPGQTVCNSDLGIPVSYIVQPVDAGTTLVNNAVVTVRPVGGLQAFQAADPAAVEVFANQGPTTTVAVVIPVTGSTGLAAQLIAAVLSVIGGAGLVLVGRRRAS